MDYYKILETERDSSLNEIKLQFKKLSKKYHPDRNEGNKDLFTRIFKQIYEAYKILSNKNKKIEYDKYLLKFSEEDKQEFSIGGKKVNLIDYKVSLKKLWIKNLIKFIDNNLNIMNKKFINHILKDYPYEYKEAFNKIKEKYNNMEKEKEYTIDVNLKDFYLNKSQKVIIKRKEKKIPITIPLTEKIYKDIQNNIIFKINVLKYKNYNINGNDIILEKYVTMAELIENKLIEVYHLNEEQFKINISEINNDNQIIIENKGLKYGNDKYGNFIIKFNVIIPENIGKLKNLIE